jgi:excisionase family DNA binding protein
MNARSVNSARRALASREEVAEYLNIPVSTLSYWAMRHEGPPYRLVGRVARYAWVEVDRWVAEQQGGGAA